MAYYAFLDEDNIVVEVISGKDEGVDGINWEQWYGDFRGKVCKRTSYNTVANIHKNGGQPFRKNYAGIGYKYDEQRDAFVPPSPYPSWVLNEETCVWESPVPKPDNKVMWFWDEATTSWIWGVVGTPVEYV